MRPHPFAASALVAWLGAASPVGAEPIGHVPPLPPPTLEEQLLISAGTAGWIARGRFEWNDLLADNRSAREGVAFFDVTFVVDEILFGPDTDARLPLRIPGYPAVDSARPASWGSRLFARSALRALDGELRDLERRLAARELAPADYQASRVHVRREILESPGYRDGRHLLLAVEGQRGCGDPYRATDVLVEKGAPYVLFTSSDPAGSARYDILFTGSFDVQPASRELPSPEALEPARADARLLLDLNVFARADAVFVGVVESGGETGLPRSGAPPSDRGFDRVRYRVEEVLRGDLGAAPSVDVRHPIVGARTVLRRVPPALLSPGSRLLVVVSRRDDAWVAARPASGFPRPATPERLFRVHRELEMIREVVLP